MEGDREPLLGQSYKVTNYSGSFSNSLKENQSSFSQIDENQNVIYPEGIQSRLSLTTRQRSLTYHTQTNVIDRQDSWTEKNAFHNKEISLSKRLHNKVRGIGKPPQFLLKLALSILTVVFMVGFVVMTPLYTSALSNKTAGSDAYIAIFLAAMWFPLVFFLQITIVKVFIDRSMEVLPRAPWKNIILVGSLVACNGILMGFSSLPSRTPPHLQALLQTMLVPCTVIARYIILRKGRLHTCQK